MAPVLGALSTGHEIGLAVVGGLFIVLALAASFLAPRRWPDFPGRNVMSVFLIGAIAMFAAMIAAVAVFGAESEAAPEKAGAQGGEPAAQTVQVTETEFKIALPATTLPAGEVTLTVKNDGKLDHDLAIRGGEATGPSKTALIKPGAAATLKVSLAAGTYTLFCSVAGHEAAGMVARLTVG